jgi:hypothetical protein
MVLYLVDEKNNEASSAAVPSVGFGIQYPGEKKTRAITWMVRDEARKDEIVISQ